MRAGGSAYGVSKKVTAVDMLETNIECCLHIVNIMSNILRVLIASAPKARGRYVGLANRPSRNHALVPIDVPGRHRHGDKRGEAVRGGRHRRPHR